MGHLGGVGRVEAVVGAGEGEAVVVSLVPDGSNTRTYILARQKCNVIKRKTRHLKKLKEKLVFVFAKVSSFQNKSFDFLS